MPEISEEDLKQLKARSVALDKAERERDAFRQQAETANARITEMETKHTAEISRVRGEAERGSAMDRAGITDPKVRKYFEGDYADAVAAAGDKPPSFGDWLGALTAEAAPHLAPWLPKSGSAGGSGGAGAGAGGGGAGAKSVPNVVGGSPPPANPTFTPESIAAMTAAEFRAALPALLAAGHVSADVAAALQPPK